ncbi:MAG: acyl-CoA dehydrogenase family protein [Desulfamplus sp.]|nr:acyl-CoA dehydrogenase family protein [Desulfamplus sp.]
MDMELNADQISARQAFRQFVEQHVIPTAAKCDALRETPPELIESLAREGYLGALVPKEYGGEGMDGLKWGLLCEAMGYGSASLLSLLTVHSMVIQAVLKWGTQAQREKWLPPLASGKIIAGFALTENKTGSDAKNTKTSARQQDDGTWLLQGNKKWMSFGQVASLFLILAQIDGKATAFLVERGSRGFSTEPITGMMGFRSAMLAQLHMDDCLVPAENILGRPGFGFSHVIGTALDQGRYSIAWGCAGLARACVDACLDYTDQREQFGVPIREHQLIQEMIADMITQSRAAQMLCFRAASLKEQGDPSLIMETSMAKYFASRAAVKIASDAVQIHGANGCSNQFPVERHFRDAKIMEIIEGSNQMQQIIIARYGYQRHQIKKKGGGNP